MSLPNTNDSQLLPLHDPIPSGEIGDVFSTTTTTTTTPSGPAANANGTYQTVKETLQSKETDTQSAFSAIKDHPVTQSVSNGPVAQNIKAETAKTQSELGNLSASRTTPSQPAATGQSLTHYHSMFYTLLSWKNPRATGLAFISTVAFIFAARYLNVVPYFFKFLCYSLGLTASAEIAGHVIFSTGFTSQIRPKKYYTIPRETLDRMLDDLHELINFFVMEFQRILFAENISHTIACFLASLISYGLIKIVPFWGLSLIATCVLYMAPLIYVNNKEIIDSQIQYATNTLNRQATQVKEVAGQHTARATETVKQYAGDYTSKAQEYIGSTRSHSNSPVVSSAPSVQSNYTSSDFPIAPKKEPILSKEPNASKPSATYPDTPITASIY
ncbi:MAG: hypothetical protein M1829_004440 [Trizodia sp. TS-e1964]|nr:MAG: hypothetical protein M1829_004440 [Trizodia sp. TS-e1964]